MWIRRFLWNPCQRMIHLEAVPDGPSGTFMIHNISVNRVLKPCILVFFIMRHIEYKSVSYRPVTPSPADHRDQSKKGLPQSPWPPLTLDRREIFDISCKTLCNSESGISEI